MRLKFFSVVFFAGACLKITALAAPLPTTIGATNHFAYSANTGWIDWRGDTIHGAVITRNVCSGYLYSANTGWINLGSGAPADGLAYQNNSTNDFGVNLDAAGNLRGFAYAANTGWINFENLGAPSINLLTGVMSGSAWSANCGWISLSNTVARVQTDTISPGPLDTNGLPIAWELKYFGHLGVDPNADPDHDGISNAQEYLADTSPVNGSDYLAIIAENFANHGANPTLTWNSVPSRYYSVQKTLSLASPFWTDSNLGLITPDAGPITQRALIDSATPMGYYRVQAINPLAP